MANGINVNVNGAIKNISGINSGLETQKNISDVYVGVSNTAKPVWNSVKGNRLFGVQATNTFACEIDITNINIIKTFAFPSQRESYVFIGGIAKRLFGILNDNGQPVELNQDTFIIVNTGAPSLLAIGGNSNNLVAKGFQSGSKTYWLVGLNPDNMSIIYRGPNQSTRYFYTSTDGIDSGDMFCAYHYSDDGYNYNELGKLVNIGTGSIGFNAYFGASQPREGVGGTKDKLFICNYYSQTITTISQSTGAIISSKNIGVGVFDIGGTK